MTTKMKALKTFMGRPDEGDKGKVRMGREFTVSSPVRAKLLETSELAVPAARAAKAASATRATNTAAAKGPTKSAGGRTGAAKTASSSRRAPAPSRQASSKPKAGLGS